MSEAGVDSNGGVRAAYGAHPFLDPFLANTNPTLFRHLYKWYVQIREDAGAYNAFLNKILHAGGERRPLEANRTTAAYYLNEAVGFIGELLLMVPPEVRSRITPRPDVMGCPDIRELLTLIFESNDRRVSFEAQRKLYLSKLFFDVDHSWEVQRGAEHKEYFEEQLERELLAHTVERRPVDVCYGIRPDGETIEYTLGQRRPGQECWSFDLREVELIRDGRPLRFHIYFHTCRFKREVIPFQYSRGEERYHLAPTEFWPGLTKRRSASIVSKMIRKGENDVRWIEDLIGAMFIVESLYEVENLKEYLFDLFGGAFRVRNAVDTLNNPADRALLSQWSGSGYEVYKAEVDILYNSERYCFPSPYFFTVEIQLYTLESYLRTVHSAHYANHQAFKRREFLQGLCPHLFPAAIYGQEVLDHLVNGGQENGNGRRRNGQGEGRTAAGRPPSGAGHGAMPSTAPGAGNGATPSAVPGTGTGTAPAPAPGHGNGAPPPASSARASAVPTKSSPP